MKARHADHFENDVIWLNVLRTPAVMQVIMFMAMNANNAVDFYFVTIQDIKTN
jgi:hypothetical protein